MAKFSDRMGITQSPTELQVDNIGPELRNTLWNLLSDVFAKGGWHGPLVFLFRNYFKLPTDEVPGNRGSCKGYIKARFMEMDWYEIYNLAEFVIEDAEALSNDYFSPNEVEILLNICLERELSGYRVVQGELVPITDKGEIETILQAASEPSSLGLAGVSEHISAALHLLGRKPEPDYRNSIKESISAVEGICKLLTGEKSGGIDKALAKLAGSIEMHGALKQGFSKLYGYTSDESGVRHPILKDSNVGFAEAKYMLVTCSAFINFLIDKGREAGLL